MSKKWFDGQIVFSRENSVERQEMPLKCFACNGGYYDSKEWGESSYTEVRDFRENVWGLTENFRHLDGSEQIKLREKIQGWGSEMARLYLEQEKPDRDDEHVVFFSTPSNLRNATDVEDKWKNSYNSHLAYHIAREFCLFLHNKAGLKSVKAVLPHGCVYVMARHGQEYTKRGTYWSRNHQYLHNPSRAVLDHVRTADHIHIVDDNIVYGSSIANFLNRIFLMCEEVENFDADLNVHTWYAATNIAMSRGGGTPLRNFQNGALRVNWVEEALEKELPLRHKKQAQGDGGILNCDNDTLSGNHTFWNRDLLYERAQESRTKEAEANALAEEKRRKIEEGWGDIKDMEMDKFVFEPTLERLEECYLEISRIDPSFIIMVNRDKCHELISMRNRLVNHAGVKRGLHAFTHLTRSEPYPWEAHKLLEAWKKYRPEHWEELVIEELIDEVERIVQDSKKLIVATKALEKSSRSVTNEIGLIYEEIRDNANQLKEECTKMFDTLADPVDSIFINRIRKKLKESRFKETLSLDTPEKVVAAEPREEKYNQKILYLDRAEENYRIASMDASIAEKSYLSLERSVDEVMDRAESKRITPNWWQIYRTQDDLDEVMKTLLLAKDLITGLGKKLEELNELFKKPDFSEDNLTPGPHCKAWLENKCSRY